MTGKGNQGHWEMMSQLICILELEPIKILPLKHKQSLLMLSKLVMVLSSEV